ncbi:MAG: glutamine synthetase family protein [Dehalococcoidia bacterium]|nr:glutamine synthetase family protein [Dehalococcoidia bacterium]MDW8119686.1 glutamine synthetase family protein [Chloroflexota bacterium]
MVSPRNDTAIQYVLHQAREQDIKFIRLWFPDILGHLKGMAITVEELEDALTRGVGFDGSSIEGFARVDESDMIALPDPTTFRILPWRPREKGVARLFCDILTPDGRPFEGDPRYVLKRNLERAARLGYTFYVGPELEFFYLTSSERPEPLDQGGYFEQTPADEATDLRRDTVLTLAEMGIPVKHSHHEGAPGQHEIDFQYTDALSMADNLMTARLVIKEVALRHGVYATFMPKPFYGVNGSGMHTNVSLFRGDRNAFYDPQDPLKISGLAKAFVAGLLRHAREITLVTNQWVNSYKRLVPGHEAPVYITWAPINRSDLIRIPAFKGREDAVRIEYRAPDPACNPYLAFAVILAAGLEGVEKEYPLPPPVEENVFALSDAERQARGILPLPTSLWEAIQFAQNSDLLRRALGEHVFTSLLRNKMIEWERFRAQVTDYEVKRYLPLL